MKKGVAAALAVWLMWDGGQAWALEIEGSVYVDHDGDGRLSAGDEVIAGAVVSWDGEVFVVTDDQGRFSMTVPNRDGIVWVRVPDGFEPRPTWAKVAVADGDAVVDLAVVPSQVVGPLTFVVASDSHTGARDWGIEEFRHSLAQLGNTPGAHFFTITGDITQANRPEQFGLVIESTEEMDLPFVPVPGNHDWYDNGASYREHFGPDQYSFSVGGVHFVVLNHSGTLSSQVNFLERDLALVEPGTTVVAFNHGSPRDDYRDAMVAAGVNYLFTGHWHSNRVIDHGAMLELNTQTMVMGGIDFTPAGYRVVTIDDGDLHVYHRTIVERDVVAVTYPLPGQCIPPQPFELLAAVEMSGPLPDVMARLNGSEAISLTAAGGWVYRADMPALAPGYYEIEIEARSGGRSQFASTCFDVCGDELGDLTIADWSQHQAGPAHHGSVQAEVEPPLRTVWTRSVGGHIQGGSVSVADGVVYVPVADFADGSAGGVAAFDARSGAHLWTYRTGYAVRNTPAVSEGTVVVSSTEGRVHALDAASGEVRWVFDLGDGYSEMVSTLYAAPTILDGVVYIGTQSNFAAIDLVTGLPLWSRDPSPRAIWLGSYAAAGIADGVVVGAFSRGVDGIVGWDAATGAELWRILEAPPAPAMNASPVIADGVVFLGTGTTVVYGYDLFTGERLWSSKLWEDGFDWGYGIAATPAYADGVLFVPTQYEHLHALDAASGVKLWKYAAGESVIHPAHYQARARTFSASPAVTGGIVWAASSDGWLSALDATSGARLWRLRFESPILSGVVPAGDLLFVATYDGTVHALAPERFWTPEGDGAPECIIDDDLAGCSCAPGRPASGSSSAGLWLILGGLIWLRWSRRRV